jgi:hypothetical protein
MDIDIAGAAVAAAQLERRLLREAGGDAARQRVDAVVRQPGLERSPEKLALRSAEQRGRGRVDLSMRVASSRTR